jgi:murein DD-endopeptidase MepM/ murein hydrolase activator NlpD
LLSLAVFSGMVMDAHGAPWPPRTRQTDDGSTPGLHQLKNIEWWPAEPPSPELPLDEGRFVDAMTWICASAATANTGRQIAEAILAAAKDAKVDPFLLGALVYRLSRCKPQLHTPFGTGLLQIQPRMIAANIQENQLVYQVLDGTTWVTRRRDVPPVALRGLRSIETNVRLGAAVLGMWEDQHLTLDTAFPENKPHRSAVAHFGWGDIVRSTAGEDRALIARRRLIAKYLGIQGKSRLSSLGFPVVSPLEGEPRVATSGMGEDRAGGARPHCGIDIDATGGEPVFSIADGTVTFAGFDLPGRGPGLEVSPKRIYRSRPNLGPGGLFVCIRHNPTIVSCYMHLASYRVQKNDVVKAGDIIGKVGRSGVKVSSTHLHLEIRRDGNPIDPAPIIGSELLVPPKETLAHDRAKAEKRQRLKAERRAQRKARLEAQAARS